MHYSLFMATILNINFRFNVNRRNDTLSKELLRKKNDKTFFHIRIALNGAVKLWTFDSYHDLKLQSTTNVKEIKSTICFILERKSYVLDTKEDYV